MAEIAENVKLWSGTLKSYTEPLNIITPSKGANVLSIYLYREAGTDYWMNWLQDTDVASGAVAADPVNRRFYTQGGPQWGNLANGETAAFNAVALGEDGSANPRWGAVADGGKVWTSDDDGVTWVEQTSTITENINDLVWSATDSEWVLVADNAEVWTSPDLVSFTFRTSQFAADDVLGIAENGSGTYVIVGGAGKISSSVDSGATWTARGPIHAGDILYGVAHGKDKDGVAIWATVGANGKISSSPDFTAWTARTSGISSDLRAVDSNGETLWVAVGDLGTIITSPGAVEDWKLIPLATLSNLLSVRSNRSSIWQVGGATGTYLISAYGETWKQKPPFTTESLNGFGYDGSEIWMVGGTTGKLFSSRDNTPRKWGSDIGITGGTGGELPFSSYNMGVPAPSLTPSVTDDAAGSGTVVDRSYVYTFVTGWGEEGPPSAPSNILAWQDGDTVTVDDMNVVALAGDNIVAKRIYRLNTGTVAASFQFVAEIPLATATYVDTIDDEDLGTSLETTIFDPPPPDLASVVAVPNGVLAGYSGQEICFSEPNNPYAWPIKYRQKINYPAVGMGVTGLTLVVATEGEPYVFTGVHPSQMTQRRLMVKQSCVSKRGLEETAIGVVWPSPDGLFFVSESTYDIVTKTLFTRDEWQDLNPSTMHSAVHDGRYYGWYDADGDGVFTGLIFDPREKKAFLVYVGKDFRALQTDLLNDALYVMDAGTIQQWDANPANNLTYKWRSGKKRTGKINLGAAKIYGNFTSLPNAAQSLAYNANRDAIIAANAALFALTVDPGMIGGSPIGMLPIGSSGFQDVPPLLDTGVILRIYADDNIVHAESDLADETAFTLPAGFRAKEWQVEVEARIPVEKVFLGTSIKALKGM